VNKQPWSKVEINFVIREFKKGFSRYEIAKKFRQKFGYKRTPDSIKHCIGSNCSDIEKDLPKVLVLDIETAPMIGYIWSLFDQNVPLNMLLRDWFILSWTAKWLHEDKVMYKDQRNKKGKALENDKALLVPLWKLMNEADILITQNGISFDIKKLNAKFLEHGMGIPAPFKHIDTYRLAKKHFGFTSNKLEYMSKKFNTKYKKQDHEEFSGFKLWSECMGGNIKAWKSMERYNNFDVLATEELFTKLAVFDKTEVVTQAMRVINEKKATS
jgi:DNA polymerase elongation subunit (family B)